MEIGAQMKRHRSKTGIAIVSSLLCVLGSTNARAAEKQTAPVRLQISVMVIPTLVAAQPAARPNPQPSPSLVTFNFQSEQKNSANFSVRSLTTGDRSATAQPAVLETMTMVSD